jgi:hypothetical protein
MEDAHDSTRSYCQSLYTVMLVLYRIKMASEKAPVTILTVKKLIQHNKPQ